MLAARRMMNAQAAINPLCTLSAWTQDGGTWAFNSATCTFTISATTPSGTHFQGGAPGGAYMIRHDVGSATVHFTAGIRFNLGETDGVCFAFNPSTGAGYQVRTEGGSFNGGLSLLRWTSDAAATNPASASGNPIDVSTDYDANIEVVYNASTGAISVYFGSVASGVTPLRISYTDPSPLAGTWFGATEFYSSAGGRWSEFVLL